MKNDHNKDNYKATFTAAAAATTKSANIAGYSADATETARKSKTAAK